MNSGRFFMPGMWGSNIGMNPMLGVNSFTRPNLFSRLFSGIKSFNWSGLLNGANKTLNVVNQTIPLIKQTKPMINNVRNMVSLAKAFRKETKTNNPLNSQHKRMINANINQKKEVIDNGNYPNFFI